jgi:hypothetical protein
MLHHLQGIITIKASYFQGLTQAIVSPFAIQFARQIQVYRLVRLYHKNGKK